MNPGLLSPEPELSGIKSRSNWEAEHNGMQFNRDGTLAAYPYTQSIKTNQTLHAPGIYLVQSASNGFFAHFIYLYMLSFVQVAISKTVIIIPYKHTVMKNDI